MGDHGRLYAGFNENFINGMAKLCGNAHIIVPNITEACFMTDTPYTDGIQTEDYIKTILQKLSKITSADIVLTGVTFKDNEIGAAYMSAGKIGYVFKEKIDVAFHGTGDVFASCLLAALMKGFPLEKATETAVNFVVICILKTKETVGRRHYGVNFELCIKDYLELLEI